MKELADLLSVYLSLGAGFLMFWFSYYRGFSLGNSIEKALVAGLIFFIFGVALKVVVILITGLGGMVRAPSRPAPEEPAAMSFTEKEGE